MVELERWDDAPLFRKIAMGTWPDATSASVYSLLELDMSKALPYMEKYSKIHDIKITPTHLVGRALCHVLKHRPEINGMIRGKRIWLRKHVDLFFSVNVSAPNKTGDKVGKATLSGTTVFEAENKSLAEIAKVLQEKAESVRTLKDKNFKGTFRILRVLPWWFSSCFLKTVSFLVYGLNLNLTWLGLPRDPFGSVIISNVGGMGVDVAWAPLMNYSRVPLLLTIGTVTDKAVVVNKVVEVRPVISIGVTFDHRFIDGVQAAHMSREFKRCFEAPEEYLT